MIIHNAVAAINLSESSRTPQGKRLRPSSNQKVSAAKRLNKDGHLITRNYVLPTPAPGGAPEHNLTLSNASPSIPFYSFAPDPQLARRAFLTVACTRLRLVSHGVSISDPVPYPVRSDQLWYLLFRSHPGTAKTKSRHTIKDLQSDFVVRFCQTTSQPRFLNVIHEVENKIKNES